MDKLVFSLREIAAGLNKSPRTLERLLGRDGVLDLRIGTMKTIVLGGSRVVPRHEFDRFVRDAGIIVSEPAAASQPAKRNPGRPRDASKRRQK